uniref:NADH dehydrogenase subunit 6 n=1 Tax=Eucrate crenata TaxID=486106 RepID=UPI0021CD0174|nr:NADH dehydrogenase subunit 6 [Eucrate crenata]UWM93447.1 NADH dehydrogenase subunit 6 [Eucrate crenata]WAK85101.1 NADH dehydrogenase subunit 6 [Eucrate crenata]
MTLLSIPLIVTLSFFFTRLSHPLALGLILLLQTMLIAMSAGLFTYSFWFSYILFMIFLGGMLVLFIYVASLASNELFSFSLTNFLFFSSMLILITFMLMFMDPLLISNHSSLLISSANSIYSTYSNISWIYSFMNSIFTLFIIFYLLLTLIVVVKIVNLFKGPLRLTN